MVRRQRLREMVVEEVLPRQLQQQPLVPDAETNVQVLVQLLPMGYWI